MRTIIKYFTTLQTLSWISGDNFIEDKAISFNMQIPENEKPLLPPCCQVFLKFHTVAELRNSGKSVKFSRSLSKYMSESTYLRLISANWAVFAINLQIYMYSTAER